MYQKIGSSSLVLMGSRLSNFGILPSEKMAQEEYPMSGIDTQAMLLKSGGGFNQQDRMIYDKRRSLDRALLYSYQSTPVRKVSCGDNLNNITISPIGDLDTHKFCRALINPDKLKADYDEKVLSIHWEENVHAGDVLEWVGTNTYWLCYLQDLDEKAYFRSKIRRCSYEIEWEDEDGSHNTYAAVRGPVETKINFIQKHSISIDKPNYSLSIMLPRNKETLKQFQRYSKFYLKDQDEGSPQICWRVEAVDWISTPGILELNAVEYYSNEFEDDTEKGLVGVLKKKDINPNSSSVENYIIGDTFIEPKKVYLYKYTGLAKNKWIVDNPDVCYNINPENPKEIKIKWNNTISGEFTLKYGKLEKIIKVQSLI